MLQIQGVEGMIHRGEVLNVTRATKTTLRTRVGRGVEATSEVTQGRFDRGPVSGNLGSSSGSKVAAGKPRGLNRPPTESDDRHAVVLIAASEGLEDFEFVALG